MGNLCETVWLELQRFSDSSRMVCLIMPLVFNIVSFYYSIRLQYWTWLNDPQFYCIFIVFIHNSLYTTHGLGTAGSTTSATSRRLRASAFRSMTGWRSTSKTGRAPAARTCPGPPRGRRYRRGLRPSGTARPPPSSRLRLNPDTNTYVHHNSQLFIHSRALDPVVRSS